MLTYNRPQFLGRAIQSVIDQSLEDWELIVVQDGPNQQTAAVMEEWVKRDLRIRYFQRERVGNIANASNYGLARAGASILRFLMTTITGWRPTNSESKWRSSKAIPIMPAAAAA